MSEFWFNLHLLTIFCNVINNLFVYLSTHHYYYYSLLTGGEEVLISSRKDGFSHEEGQQQPRLGKKKRYLLVIELTPRIGMFNSNFMQRRINIDKRHFVTAGLMTML